MNATTNHAKITSSHQCCQVGMGHVNVPGLPRAKRIVQLDNADRILELRCLCHDAAFFQHPPKHILVLERRLVHQLN